MRRLLPFFFWVGIIGSMMTAIARLAHPVPTDAWVQRALLANIEWWLFVIAAHVRYRPSIGEK